MARGVRIAALAALALTLAAQPGLAARKQHAAQRCAAASAAEAEAAIRYITDLMVASSACQNTTYAEFRLRNKDAIIAYQHALIRRFHGTAAFDHWNTSLANEAAQRQAMVAPALFCQQQGPLMKQASALDSSGFRAYAAAQAAAAPTAKCGR